MDADAIAEQAVARRKVLADLMHELLDMQGDGAELEARLATWTKRWQAAYCEVDDALDK